MTHDPLTGWDVSLAPGQARLQPHDGRQVVDFSHGDVDAFPPLPAALEHVTRALTTPGAAYSPYRGHAAVRARLAPRLAGLLGSPVDPDRELIVTPGTQAGLFLALSATVRAGDRVAVVEPDYFANRRIVEVLGAQPVPVPLDYADPARPAELDLDGLRSAFAGGARVLVLSNPNNPTGAVHPERQVRAIADLAREHDVLVVVDQLYCRLLYPGTEFTHLRRLLDPDRCVTLLGPSKTESLSGFRTGVAIAGPAVVDRMEQLLGIVSLRTAGYNQFALDAWLDEPAGWLAERVAAHQAIRDDLVAALRNGGLAVRPTEAGSYLFPRLPDLPVSGREFVARLRAAEGIVVTAGTEFAAGTGNSVRLNFSQDHTRALDAVRRLTAFAGTLR
ncbi:aminotransferase class I/II-fold pyridoxal phosphate-dependent enzyme [Kineococcus sp. SYSU DK003]|uniref:aminotransferase class I/II-fold pyridoxal phosphate-dependent enzyme n=1 Tax=Kineococcus sp. SYSU DK003 TaxID=3383124 RepID=UPI003D7C9D0D